MKPPKIVMRKIKDIKRAPYNPPDRAERAKQSALRTNIEEIGLQIPLLISPDNDLVDGHRRIAILEDIHGPEYEVPCIITITPIALAYSGVNTTVVKMTGIDMLHLYFNGGALTPIQKGKCDRAVEIIGEQMVKQLYENGYALNVLQLSLRVGAYCSLQENKPFIRRGVKWIMKHGVVPIRTAIELRTSSEKVREAIDRDLPLNLRVDIE